MKKVPMFRRVLAVVLTVAMLCAYLVPSVSAAQDTSTVVDLPISKVDGIASHINSSDVDESIEAQGYAMDDIVRVSIVLEKPSTIAKGYSTEGIAANAGAMAYRNTLKQEQADVTSAIEAATGSELEVKWNLTLAANIISANVKYGDIAAIEKIPGVKEVVLENCYEPQDDVDTSTSGIMTGAYYAWAEGYTGAGSKLAVIDTGIDPDHQSFDGAAYEYSLAQNAEAAGMTYEEYVASLNLLTAEKVAAVKDQLNVSIDPNTAYLSSKVPYAYNYVDGNYTVDHDHDSQSEHGSHVEGIAAANAYIPNGDGTYSDALSSVMVKGAAPDAQIVTMKVFGAGGGAYDSDYMAAIEDAIVLGCDSANLSLGSGGPGMTISPTYQALLDSLADCDTAVVMSAGNSYSWPNYAESGVPYLYLDDVSMDTAGSPGSFVNSMSVASVDNAGTTGKPLKFGDITAFYTESSGYSNPPIASTIPGDHDFVYIDCPGVDEKGNNLLTNYAELVAGKVVLVNRGSSSFYQKMDAAAAAGAIACVVVNNQDGTINMDLSSAKSQIPCVSITLANGLAIKAASQKTNDGSFDIYTGTVTVSNTVESVMNDSPYHVMSDFSSWGVPGALIMKPEITAPGGNIYSVNGAIAGGTSYEVMSGTSMAAPQITGLVAVLGQYIRENNLVEKTGLSARHLANSLLMSTAEPVFEEDSGYYWSILKQGSGLASVIDAVNAKSYIKMGEDATASAADYKVKAELGDDPDRTGTYSFSFSINNFSDETAAYNLNADFFTQDAFAHGDNLYMDTWTTPLAGNVSYTVNGVPFESLSAVDADVDGDGDTDADDAQAILNYVAGLTDSIAACADVDGDGEVTSYDAYLILTNLVTTSFEVGAGESAEVVVSFQLDEDMKAYLDTYYTSGAYVEGYVYVNPVASDEGVLSDVEYSIPVLGFYGNWTDGSMYDAVTYAESVYGTTKASYPGVSGSNVTYVRYDGSSNVAYTGNPYGVEETYPAGKLAMNSNANIYQAKITLIRNAAMIVPFAADENGKVLWMGSPTSNALSAYYYVNGGAWQNTTRNVTINKTVGSLKVAEGEKLTVGIVAVPEYYGVSSAADVQALIESGALGEGAYFANTFVVDDTAPEVLSATKDLLNNTITVSASDNLNVAYLAVMDKSGNKVLAGGIPSKVDEDGTASVTIDLEGTTLGKECLIVAADYAGNESAYSVQMGGEEPNYDGKMYGFTSASVRGSGDRWVEITPEKLWYNTSTSNGEGYDAVCGSPITVTAADYVNGYVYMTTAGAIYVAPQGEWESPMKVGNTSITFRDLAYSTSDSTLYGLDDANHIYSIDTTTGATELVATVTVSHPTNTSASYAVLRAMAIDDEGNFYVINHGMTSTAFLFKFTLADVVDGAVTVTAVNPQSSGRIGAYAYNNCSAAWDHDNDKLYFAAAYNANSDYDQKLWVIDTETGVGSLAQSTYRGDETGSSCRPSCLQANTVGLYIVPSSAAVPPVTAPTSIELSAQSMGMLVGLKRQLVADVFPWNLTDKSVTWVSSDPSVVTVDENGNIEAVAVGTATVTATTVATPALSASCEITVEAVPVASMTGLVYSADGTPNWADFSSDAPAAAAPVAEGSSYFGGALVGDILYTVSEDTMFAVDADAFTVTSLGEIASSWLYADGAGVPEELIDVYGGKVIAPCNGGTYLEILDPEAGSLNYWSGIASYYADDPMAAIALVGRVEYEDYEDAILYYVLTEGGELWAFTIYDGGYLNRQDLGNVGVQLGNVSAVTAGYYASMVYDAESGFLYLASYNPDVNDKSAVLYAIDPDMLVCVPTGDFGDGVWPALALYQYERVTELTLQVKTTSIEIYEGGSDAISVKVKPASFTGGVTFTSDNTDVATVDENGVVTGVAEGTANITVTTVDVNANGKHLSVVVPVTVNGIISVNASIKAQVSTTADSYVEIDLNDMSADTLGAAPAAMVAGGMGAGTIFGLDADGKMYEIDGTSFEVNDSYNFNQNYYPIDLTTYPGQTVTIDGTDYPLAAGAAFFTEGQYLMLMDPVAGKLSGFDLSSWDLSFCGITYVGSYVDDNGTTNLVYYVLSQNGDVYLFSVYPKGTLNTSGAPVMGLSRSDALDNVGVEFSDLTAVSLGYYWDGNDGGVEGLVIADNATGYVYWSDLTADTLAAGAVGTVSGSTNIAGLYGTFDAVSSVEASATTMRNVHEDVTQNALMGLSEAEQSTSFFTVGETANAVAGSVNAVKAEVTVPQIAKGAVGETGISAGTVSVVVSDDAAMNNGKISVTYDSSAMTFVKAESTLDYVAVGESDGVVTIAFASESAVPAGEAIATLKFSYNSFLLDTTVEIAVEERDDNVDANEEPVEVEAFAFVFEDVSRGCSYFDAVVWAVENGVTTGATPTTFNPTGECTRGQIVTMLWRAAGEPAPESTENPFTDVPAGKYYTNAVLWAVENGIVKGTSATTFKPDDQCTRGQIVTMLWRAAGEPAPESTESPFTDVPAGKYYTDAVAWAVENEIAKGTTPTTFAPEETCNRAQAVTFLYRAYAD